MKNLLLLSLTSIFIFSCTVYDDDGLPDVDDGVVVNPDGTKKLKSIYTVAEGTVTFDIVGTTMNEEIHSVTETIFDANSFSNVSTITTSVGNEEDPMVSILTQTWDETRLMSTNRSEDSIIYTYNFAYNEDQLEEYNFIKSSVMQGTGTVTYSDNDITLTTTARHDSYIPTSTIFNLTDGYISSMEITNTLDNLEYSVAITRENNHITQMTITSPNGEKSFEYFYADDINSMHAPWQTPIQQTTAEIANLLITEFYKNFTSQNTNIDVMESSLRPITLSGTKNVSKITSEGETLYTASYSYDNEGYMTTSETQNTVLLEMDGILEGMTETITAIYQGMGFTQEQIDEMIASFQANFENGETFIDVSTNSEYTYFE